jgi:hypothetical protein
VKGSPRVNFKGRLGGVGGILERKRKSSQGDRLSPGRAFSPLAFEVCLPFTQSDLSQSSSNGTFSVDRGKGRPHVAGYQLEGRRNCLSARYSVDTVSKT